MFNHVLLSGSLENQMFNVLKIPIFIHNCVNSGSSVRGSNFMGLRATISHFSKFIFNPEIFLKSKNNLIALFSDSKSFTSIVMSSANWMTLCSKFFICKPLVSPFSFIFQNSSSATSKNKRAEMGHPWILLDNLKFCERYPLLKVNDPIYMYSRFKI